MGEGEEEKKGESGVEGWTVVIEDGRVGGGGEREKDRDVEM